jgi:DNA-binding transcriptional LysR family regulator
MAQPPLSYQIKRLEEELGAQLFYRTKRSVRLTGAGHLLLGEARDLLVHAEQTASMVHRVGQGEVGQLRVGFVPSAANWVLPPIVRAFGERFPSVELLLREVDPDRLLRTLADGRVDVGFLYLPFEEDSLDSRPVSRETFVAALPDTHPLSDEPRVPLRALADEPFVLTPRYQGAGRQDRRALPASRYRAQSGTGGLAHADYRQPRGRRNRRNAGSCLSAKPPESRGHLQIC